MRFSSIASLSAVAGLAVAAPYSPFPLPDGFPAPSAAELKEISMLAGGSLPGGSLPSKLTPTAAVTVQLIALNEIFEVAFFTDLIYNITNKVHGYDLSGTSYDEKFVLEALTAIKNQEELHALGANAILKTAGQTTIAPCQYNFPVTDFLSAITLANTFTDVVIGVLPMAQTVFASDSGDELPLVNLLGSIISQESEQNGWYRTLQEKVPSAAPFLTTEGPAFAFTFLQGVIAPGCAGVDLVKKSVPTFGALTVVSKPGPKNSTIEYSVMGSVSAHDNAIVYISGQNLPVTVPISNVHTSNGVTTFCAEFPFETGFAKGLSIAALVKGTGSFANSTAVASATVFGPGIIEVE